MAVFAAHRDAHLVKRDVVAVAVDDSHVGGCRIKRSHRLSWVWRRQRSQRRSAAEKGQVGGDVCHEGDGAVGGRALRMVTAAQLMSAHPPPQHLALCLL
jgi:hypothetical protein